jgi:hypothetical protein
MSFTYLGPMDACKKIAQRNRDKHAEIAQSAKCIDRAIKWEVFYCTRVLSVHTQKGEG